MRAERYQWALIILIVICFVCGAVFLYREISPQYKVFQNGFIAVEQFRSTYTGEPPPAFIPGIKQIVIPTTKNGPEIVDRCTTCHVALTIPDYSPIKIELDADGKPVLDEKGFPKKIPNENYVWKRLDDKVMDLYDEKENKKLIEQGKGDLVTAKLKEADDLDALKYAKVEDRWVYMTKVLAAHPLIGKETRPFEFHPIDEYGCTSCHNGNGRGLTISKAHGPVYDGQYEEEYEGPRPSFTDYDPNNDPPFSHVFNHKPNHELLFQTTPLFVGKLIEAKCVNCHQVTDKSLLPKSTETMSTDIDKLTSTFHYGENLYISQACYACHRIGAFSRGGVGPELTKAGLFYPWYLKLKIVWPQSTLRTSTMPNMRLDHQEIEALMAFLLAQKGKSPSVSEYDYLTSIKEWEAGKKTELEKPIPPDKINDLDFAMTIFATEGCAACHKLVGFQSNVGFSIEAGGKTPTYDELYKEREWFEKLFPEDSVGSEIVNSLDQFGAEVDKRIVADVRKDSLLERIEKEHPHLILAFYSNFQYALRAKNYLYETEAYYATDPAKKEAAMKKIDVWRERVMRVMMVYIQEYGLGRLVGPRLNWSGVYRSDQWLMEHFRNPTSTTPRSIMPAFPFDNSKFLALTNMLDVLGIRNRDAIQKRWQERGFDPEIAFQIHCAQCHGVFKHGNGPVSEWIYPLPKNLSSATFLRNLTKERAITSITHGVIGTPMAPWGEVAPGKDVKGAVLTKDQINQLVEWLFSSLPGGEVYETSQDVMKWQYTPEKALEELKNEGVKDLQRKN